MTTETKKNPEISPTTLKALVELVSSSPLTRKDRERLAVIMANWRVLSREIGALSDEDLRKAYVFEKANKNRPQILERVLGRWWKLVGGQFRWDAMTADLCPTKLNRASKR